MIYLDNAATSWPKPESVYQTMDQFMRQKGGNPGHGSHSLAVAALQVVDETRVLTARFIGAPEVERVVFTLNCTDSINLALKGVLQAGDHVITSGMEHNAVMRPLTKLAGMGIKVTRLPVSLQSWLTSTQEIEKAITPRTKMLVMLQASNVTGMVQPVADYGALARKHNLLLLVDAAQSVGHFHVNVEKDGIDLLAFSAHKGPFGPPGLGVLYIGPRVNPETLREGGTGTSSESEEQPDRLPSKYEAGTLNSVGIAGLGAGLKFINSTGLSQIQQHGEILLSLLKEGLSSIPEIHLYLPPEPGRQTPVISFNLAGYEPAEVGAILDQAFDIKVRTGLHCSPQIHHFLGSFPRGTVRLSPGYFNTEKEIQTTLQAIRKIAAAKVSGR